MGMCPKCTKITGALLLIAGVVFLLDDVGLIGSATISWYTAAFLIFGAVKIATSMCKDCQSCRAPAKSEAKVSVGKTGSIGKK